MYNLQLITYSTILNGVEKKSCTGYKLEKKYYEFLCELKTDKSKTKIITCGEHAGNHFLELCKLNKPKIFNPLVDENIDVITELSDSYIRIENENNGEVWNKLAYELYTVLNWLSICWKKELNGHLLDKKINLINNPTKEPSKSVIKAVNTSIKKGKRTLSSMIDELRKSNNIKEYKFKLLNEYIKRLDEEIDSYF